MNNLPAEGAEGLVHQCRLPLSSATLELVSGLIRGHLKKSLAGASSRRAGSPSSFSRSFATTSGLSDMAGGNGVSASTVRRWLLEVLDLLSARAARLDRALKKIARKGGVVVLLDGTLVRTRRRTGEENRPNYSGKHKAHGLLFLALTDERGNLVWISAAKPGRSSEITTARHNKITAKLRNAGLGAPADLGFVGLDDDSDDPVIITGRRRHAAIRSPPPRRQQREVVQAFLAAARDGRFEQLLQVLHPDVTFTVHTPNGTFVMLGATEVATRARVAGSAARGHAATVSGRPGVISWSKDGTPLSLLAFTVADGHITEITALVDSAKLALMDLPDPV
jgi:ketosteroid isomerase-like protein